MNQRYTRTLFLATAAAIFARSCDAECLVGDIMYMEGDNTGHIGLECIDDSTYEGSTSICGPDSAFVEELQTFTCPAYCVQCGPRGFGAALCLSTPTTDRDCGEPEYFDNNPIVCPDGQDSIPNTFCGRGNNRVDCAADEFCFIEPADRFAVCCPNPENCCDPDAYDSSWEWGNYCCSDGNWYAVDGSGGGNCQDKQLTQSVACPSIPAQGNTGDDLTEMEIKCCDPENGPGGCPDENGSFDRCWDEGGYCCSDGNWYADNGDGGGNCLDNQLTQSVACPSIPAQGNTGDDLTEMEIKCCDPENGPGGCPDENGSFDRCWDEGGYCCSDGNWYADNGDGGGNCLDKQLIRSIACPASAEAEGNGADVLTPDVIPDVTPEVIPIDQVNAPGDVMNITGAAGENTGDVLTKDGNDDVTLGDEDSTSGGTMRISGAADIFFVILGFCVSFFACK